MEDIVFEDFFYFQFPFPALSIRVLGSVEVVSCQLLVYGRFESVESSVFVKVVVVHSAVDQLGKFVFIEAECVN